MPKEWSSHELGDVVVEERASEHTASGTQHLPKEHPLRDFHTIHIILSTENKVSLAEKSQRLKSAGMAFKILSLAHKQAHP